MVCLQDVNCLCLFALLLQCLILIPYLAKVSVYPQTTRDIAYRLLDLVTHAVPITLPTVMVLVVAVAGKRLGQAGIMLMFPEALKRGAAVDVVCFDKTGTLTQSAVSSPSPLRLQLMPSCVLPRKSLCCMAPPVFATIDASIIGSLVFLNESLGRVKLKLCILPQPWDWDPSLPLCLSNHHLLPFI